MRIRPGRPADRDGVVATLVQAFRGDPLLRFLESDDAAYPPFAAAFFGCLFDLRVDGGGEVRVSDDLAAASLWNPPGGNRRGPGHVDALWERQVVPHLDAGQSARMDVFDRIASAMHPEAPHWYLGVVGVRPDRMGQGLGGAVIRAVLDDPLAAGTPAYLVTAAAGNVPLYGRLGFAVRGEADLPGGPHLWGMWRDSPAGA